MSYASKRLARSGGKSNSSIRVWTLRSSRHQQKEGSNVGQNPATNHLVLGIIHLDFPQKISFDEVSGKVQQQHMYVNSLCMVTILVDILLVSH